MAEEPRTRERRHDLDWLRVAAILLLLYFHTGMIFTAEWGWHIKNPETSHLVLEINHFLSRWRMALLFLISGVGTSFALRRRSARGYAGERAKRLLVPVLFGMLVVVPPQIYLERLAQGADYASYLHFWPSVLELRPYPAGSTSWHHLWFVVYLFLYSLAALPLFLWLRGERGRRRADRLVAGLRGPRLYALALAPGAVLTALLVRFPGPQNIVDDWAHLLYYFLYFVFGHLLATGEGAWRTIEEQRRASLTIAFLAILAIDYLRWNGLDPHLGYSLPFALYSLLHGLNAWCWVLAILGYGRRYLDVPSRVLDYANEGIYPFYILHQTVIVIVGFYVVQLEESILAKFLFVSTLSLALSWAVYELLIRPFPVARFLFGMKPRPVPAGVAAARPTPLPAGRAARPAPAVPAAAAVGERGA
jgi:glucans biosynthesis protein C